MQKLNSLDFSTVQTLRRIFDEVVSNTHFESSSAVSALEIAEHLLADAAAGERDFDRLKVSALARVCRPAAIKSE